MGMRGWIATAILGCFATVVGAHAEDRHFRVVGVEVAGAKIWMPSTLVVRKGDKVHLTFENRADAQTLTLGFQVVEYKLRTTVGKTEKKLDFIAGQSGVFDIRSHLHPDHLTGQLVVLE